MTATVVETQFALRTTNGTTDITVSGAGTCKGAVFFASGAVTDTTVEAHAHYSTGWVDSSGNAAIGNAGAQENGSANMDTSSHWSASFCIGVEGDNGGIDGAYGHDSYIPDGIRITTTNPASEAFLVTAVLLFGDDITCVDGSLLPNATVDVENTVDIGQDSDLIFWSHIDGTVSADTSGAHSTPSFAVSTWDGTTIRQRGGRCQSVNSSASGNIRQCLGDRLDMNFSGGTSINRAMECTTMDGDLVGITSRENAAPTDRPYRFMSVNFNGTAEARVEALVLPTSGSLSSTAYGFTPQFMLFSFINDSQQRNETDSFQDLNDMIVVFGAMDGTRESCCGVIDEDGAATSNATSVCNSSALYVTDVADAVYADGDFSSFDANGFTVTMNTNPGSTMAGWGLAIEEDQGGPATAIRGVISRGIVVAPR